jgi:hypothetical protein
MALSVKEAPATTKTRLLVVDANGPIPMPVRAPRQRTRLRGRALRSPPACVLVLQAVG